jgi:dTDP-4-dehydrorhamnose 3,5-epimerase
MERPVNLLPTDIDGLLIAETNSFKDFRGTFTRLFCNQDLASVIGERSIVQINQSYTESIGMIRGLHFQHPPCAEMKLVRCLKGRVWDVSVDLRAGSPTIFKWYAKELSPQDNFAMVIPEGFAHGFQVLEPNSEMLYLHTAFYSPKYSASVPYDDPLLSISWPIVEANLTHEEKRHPPIDADFSGIKI